MRRRLSKLGEWLQCPICHKYVQIVEFKPGENNWYVRKLACGDESRIWIPNPINEEVSTKDKAEAEVKTVRSVGEIPIFVSDSTGTQLTSGKVEFTAQRDVVTAGIVNYGNIIYQFNSNTTNINIQNILSMIDNDPNLIGEQKNQVKGAFSKVVDLIKTYGPLGVEVSKYIQFIPGLIH